MSTQALEFTSASEMRAHYKAVRQRLNPEPPPIIYRRPPPEAVPAAPVPERCVGMESVWEIVRIVCRFYNVSLLEFVSYRRTAQITKPRHVAYYVARETTTRVYREIGIAMGGRDHTTISQGARKIGYRIVVDPALAAEVSEIIQRVRSAASPATYSQETADAHASR